MLIEWVARAEIFHTVITKEMNLYRKFSSDDADHLRKVGDAITEVKGTVIFDNSVRQYLSPGKNVSEAVEPNLIIKALDSADISFAKQLDSKHNAKLEFSFFNATLSTAIGALVASLTDLNPFKLLLGIFGGTGFSCFFKKSNESVSPKDPGQCISSFFHRSYVDMKKRDSILGPHIFGANLDQDDASSGSKPS